MTEVAYYLLTDNTPKVRVYVMATDKLCVDVGPDGVFWNRVAESQLSSEQASHVASALEALGSPGKPVQSVPGREQAFLAGYGIALRDVAAVLSSYPLVPDDLEQIAQLIKALQQVMRLQPPETMPLVHLWTGITVCSKPTSWCGTEAIIEASRMTNMTDAEQRCTCVPCLQALLSAHSEANL